MPPASRDYGGGPRSGSGRAWTMRCSDSFNRPPRAFPTRGGTGRRRGSRRGDLRPRRRRREALVTGSRRRAGAKIPCGAGRRRRPGGPLMVAASHRRPWGQSSTRICSCRRTNETPSVRRCAVGVHPLVLGTVEAPERNQGRPVRRPGGGGIVESTPELESPAGAVDSSSRRPDTWIIHASEMATC